MAKKTDIVSPAKSKRTGDNEPIIRRQQVSLRDNPFIPNSHCEGQDRQNGRVLAFDVTTQLTPVLTSARRVAQKQQPSKPEDGLDCLSKGLANLTIHNGDSAAPKKKETADLPDKIESVPSSQKTKKEVDEEWDETESETEVVESVCSSDCYDEDDKDDLEWSLKDDEDDNVSPEDLYSPERAKGTFEYTIHDDSSGTVYNIRRCSRISFGSPAGKK